MKAKGWTLLELLIVLAIIAVIAALLQPAFADARRSAKRTACVQQLRQISIAMGAYIADHGGEGKYGEYWQMGLPPDLSNLARYAKLPRGLFQCKGDSDLPIGALYTRMYTAEDTPGQASWEAYVRVHRENSVLVTDENHDFPGTPRTTPAMPHRGIAIFLDGSVRTIISKGDWGLRRWWNQGGSVVHE